MMVLKYDLSVQVLLVLVIKGHICNLMKNFNIKSCKDLIKCVNPLGWVVESNCVNPLGWVFESHM